MEMSKLPQDPILVALLNACQRECDPAPMIHDIMGFSKGHPYLLGDVLATRERLLQRLPDTALAENQLLKNDSLYIFLLCQSGYEYLIGFFAIRAIGGAVMPLSSGILPEEGQYFQKTTSASCILFGKDCQQKVDELGTAIIGGARESTPFTSCSISTDAEPCAAANVSIDTSRPLAPGGPGIAFLTSGTTGTPKIVALPRQCLVANGLAPPGGAGINCRPGHWIGAADGMLEPILTGQSLHCIGQRATAEEVLQAFVDCRITHALFGPMLLTRMRKLILGPTGELSGAARQKYSGVFRGLSSIRAGGSTIELLVRQFWSDLTGLPFENFYASTEVGVRACSSLDGEEGCIGLPVDGVEMKLSEGTVGELHIRSATMFTHYIGNMEETKAALDEEGFFKTGDFAKFENGQYYLLGRKNIDCIRYNHQNFSTCDVENALLAIPGISAACVVGVPIRAMSQLCGALVRVNAPDESDANTTESIASLRGIRRALQTTSGLPIYMFPLLLRVLGEGETIPMTQSGKVAKGVALMEFFGGKDVQSTACLPRQVEVWHGLPTLDELGATKGDGAVKAWDWGGLQAE